MERERQSHVNGVHKPVMPSDVSQTNTTVDDSEELDINTTKNDELLYDPKSDENDEKWAESQRLSAKTYTKAPSSDATLNCPACMALLCLDCQRHDIYRTQYRAMFVFNCRVDFTQKFRFKDKHKKRNDNQKTAEEVDNYYCVFCGQCNSEVAVYDQEEVYHFFSVLASH